MIASRQYYMLISSLPALPAHFVDAERVPISKLRLDERLKMLDEDDLKVVEQMGEFLVWERQPLDRTDEEFCRHYDQFTAVTQNRFARAIINEAMAFRTIVSALRRRRLGQGPPSGVSPWADRIKRHWTQPDFRLAVPFPWIGAVDAQLNSDMPFDVERTLLELKWQYVKRLADQYYFSFEAVLLYLIRWEIVFRWTSRDAAAGQEKFERLVAEAMGPYAEIF